jgi:uncharacterized RDD family membrane protein YckC
MDVEGQARPTETSEYGQELTPEELRDLTATHIQRFLAATIDGLIFGVIALLYLYVQVGPGIFDPVERGAWTEEERMFYQIHRLWSRWATLAALIGYNTVLDSNLFGQTLGKRLVGIRVLDIESFLPIPVDRSIRRAFGKIGFGIGVFWSFNPERRFYHDLQANTIVVKSNRVQL